MDSHRHGGLQGRDVLGVRGRSEGDARREDHE